MNPRLRLWLTGTIGAAFGIVTAFEIADENYTLGLLTVFAIFWIIIEWKGSFLPEAFVLATVLAGYVLANRGFAQLSPSPRLPLLPAELALLVCGPVTLLRGAFRHSQFVRRDALNIGIILWFALGASRLLPDFRTHGAVALRDFATYYYAAFFFIAQGLVRHPASILLLRRTLLFAFAVLPFCYLLVLQFDSVFQQQLVFRGMPLIFYKDDLVAAYLFAGFLFMLTASHWPTWLRVGLTSVAYGTAFSIHSSRAAIVGLMVAASWWAVARRLAPWRYQAVFVAVGLAVLAMLAGFANEPFKRSRIYALYEHIASMVDVSGTRHYSHAERFYVGDNNRFRMVWWRSVAEEVWEFGPVFGLGFGADLSARFLRNYEIDLGDEFTTRSPHSINFTVLGRTGLAGLAAWALVAAAMFRRTLKVATRARGDDAAVPALGWWSIAWVMFGSASFGVVLEGPMGAVVFWTALGVANALSDSPSTAPHAEPALDRSKTAVPLLRATQPLTEISTAS